MSQRKLLLFAVAAMAVCTWVHYCVTEMWIVQFALCMVFAFAAPRVCKP